MQSRNDILALEYIKAAKKLDLSLKFTPVKRDPRFLSASYIRQSDDPLPFLPDAMQAELTAESQGHRVILLEKTGRLGGVLRCEKDIPFKARLDDYLNVQERRVLRSGIELHLTNR